MLLVTPLAVNNNRSYLNSQRHRRPAILLPKTKISSCASVSILFGEMLCRSFLLVLMLMAIMDLYVLVCHSIIPEQMSQKRSKNAFRRSSTVRFFASLPLSKMDIGGRILAMPVPPSCTLPSLKDWFMKE